MENGLFAYLQQPDKQRIIVLTTLPKSNELNTTVAEFLSPPCAREPDVVVGDALSAVTGGAENGVG